MRSRQASWVVAVLHMAIALTMPPAVSAQVATQPTVSAASESTAKAGDPEARVIRTRSSSATPLSGLGSQGRASSTMTLWIQTALVLAVVLAAMWLVLKWLRKKGIGGSFGGSGSSVQVLNRGYLTSKHQMVLVRFGSRLLLLGVSPQSVNVLSEIASPDEAAQVLGRIESSKAGSASRDFEQAITEAAEQYTGEPAAAELRVHTPSQEQIGAIRSEIRSLLAKMQSAARKPESE